ncbi:MAG: fatty acid hydroxylase family protein [Planctomycetota bacterium]|nr:MAG: fatty acid hydroxylase family protein [Planctomycetota bacterium]
MNSSPESSRDFPLSRAVAVFFSHLSPRVIGGAFLISLAIRLNYAQWGTGDLVAPVVILCAWPFIEWMIHVYLLHGEPIRMLGKVRYLYSSKIHQEHHLNPDDYHNSFINLPLILFGFLNYLIVSTIVGILAGTSVALTTMTTLLLFGLFYEWMHFLIHTPYKPKSSWYRKRWRYHRLHHFKNENYWMGVSMYFGDRVLGTMPNPGKVETSPTCRTLEGLYS